MVWILTNEGVDITEYDQRFISLSCCCSNIPTVTLRKKGFIFYSQLEGTVHCGRVGTEARE